MNCRLSMPNEKSAPNITTAIPRQARAGSHQVSAIPKGAKSRTLLTTSLSQRSPQARHQGFGIRLGSMALPGSSVAARMAATLVARSAARLTARMGATGARGAASAAPPLRWFAAACCWCPRRSCQFWRRGRTSPPGIHGCSRSRQRAPRRAR